MIEDDPSSAWNQYPTEELDGLLEEKLIWTDWIHRDSFQWRLLTQTKEENNVEQCLYEAHLEIQRSSRRNESSAAKTWFLAPDCGSCHRWLLNDTGCVQRRTHISKWQKKRDSKGSTNKGKCSKRCQNSQNSKRNRSKSKSIFKNNDDPMKQRRVSQSPMSFVW